MAVHRSGAVAGRLARAWTSSTASWRTPASCGCTAGTWSTSAASGRSSAGAGASCPWSWTTGRTRWCRSPGGTRRPCAARWTSESDTVPGGFPCPTARTPSPARRTTRAGAASASPPRPGAAAARPGRASNRDWWPNQLDLTILRKHPAAADPMGADFDYAAEFRTLDLDALAQGRRRGADDLAGVVARRLRPLRAARDPDGVALRRDVPRRRRPGRPGRRHAALRAAEQLAGQPQPRQGAPAALAGEEEVRPQRSPGPT